MGMDVLSLLLLVALSSTAQALSAPLVVQQQQPFATIATSYSFTHASWISSSNLLLSNTAPTSSDIQKLRNAFAEYSSRNDKVALEEFNTVIELWRDQPNDERAGLYRVRGDIEFRLSDAKAAYQDYSQAIQLMDEKADPDELPIALLGRARAGKSMASSVAEFASSAADYERALELLGVDEYDDDQTKSERIEIAAGRNPYAAWEWGDALRQAKNYQQAYMAHNLAADCFANIGDKARSVIARIDASIDVSDKDMLLESITTIGKGVESRDIPLLQRVLASENEARMAVSALLWSSGQRDLAESQLGEACLRMEQNPTTPIPRVGLQFTIDDDPRGLVGSMYCSMFKNQDFVSKLQWPDDLQRKVIQLSTLK